MPDSNDYRLYLESKFEGLTKHLNAEFINIHNTLDKIEEQTTKTNGRVSELETEMIKHPIECPTAKEIAAVKEDLIEYRMIKKYPKIFLFLIVVLVALSIWKVVDRDVKIHDEISTMKFELKTKIDQIDGVSKITRSGYVPYINNMGVLDSIKKQ